jgi:hypothetical protein
MPKPRHPKGSPQALWTAEETREHEWEPAEVTDLPEDDAATEPPAPRGRPPKYDWFKIAVVMCWHLSGKGPWEKGLTRRAFCERIQKEFKPSPSIDELERRYTMVRKWFGRN